MTNKPFLDIRELVKHLLGTTADPWMVAQRHFDCGDGWTADLLLLELDDEIEQCAVCEEWNRKSDLSHHYGECLDCEGEE